MNLLSCPLRRDFGSCHSFGVAVGLRGYGMCQMRGDFRSTIFLKMRRVDRFVFQFNFYKVQVDRKPLTCPLGKSLFIEVSPVR